ncbi:pyridoxamine 5'-phosphate oxidase family protein [Streptomyces sp. JJ36]|uniref:pyridoxamine 5'-phosphate oxidase family protein n=1 Tax=Streptomyces sp. JJ36 TaxID=2736645 RepID=UPI001F3B461D|nr:pyridoxamine 5'-phosphate oxidase family protein [Streptomyces sp. JJ36]MCF6525469.1 pyridoxamine 5'-phosphate oxidase family protein [Streptomyces sp. JJ36]
MATPTTGLQLFARERRVRLTTYERDGTPVGSPAAIVVEGDHAYVRTHRRAPHTEHLRRYPEAEVAPADLGGTPTGAPMKARVRRLEGGEARHAAARLARKHPLLHGVAVPVGYALRLDRPVHYELRLVGE